MRQTYRRVLTTFWTDPDVRRLARSIEAKGVLLYLFTGPDSTLSGLYWQPLDDIAHRCGVALDTVRDLIERWDGVFVSYDHETEEILVHRSLRHNVGNAINPKDNRFRGVVRQAADTHSDFLIFQLVKLYPDVEWPENISGRSPEGASKGLQPAPGKEIQSFPHTENGRGLEASHTHTHALTLTDTPWPNTPPVSLPTKPDPPDEGSSDKVKIPKVTDSVLRSEALEHLGAGRITSAKDHIQVNKELQDLLHDGLDRENLLAAIRGFGIVRRTADFLSARKPYTPRALVRLDAKPDEHGNPGVWWGEGDQRTKRRLIDICQEVYWRQGEEGAKSNDGPTRLSVST